ncbi:MAG: hypothetical protein U0V56_10950 [Actinomycetota bacterium]
MILPLVLPPVVGGMALLTALGRSGIVGGWLHDLGIQLTFSTGGADRRRDLRLDPARDLVGRGGLRSIDRRFEQAAAMGTSLGRSPGGHAPLAAPTARRRDDPRLGPGTW